VTEIRLSGFETLKKKLEEVKELGDCSLDDIYLIPED